jgi:hypothetical protein
MIFLSLLLACPPSNPDTVPDPIVDTGHERLRLGRISGHITMDPSLAAIVEDYPTQFMTVLAFIGVEANETEFLPYRIHVTAHISGDLADLSVPYVLDNLFPQEKPYVVAALLDCDMSVNQTGKLAPTSGDLMSAPSLLEQEEVVVGSGAELELNLAFKYLVE